MTKYFITTCTLVIYLSLDELHVKQTESARTDTAQLNELCFLTHFT